MQPNLPRLHCYDMSAAGVLPPDWQVQVAALAAGPDRQRLIEEPGETGNWTFDVVTPEIVTTALPWLSALYAGPLCRFASAAFAQELVPARRRSSTVTLNILSGIGATNVWHRDQNRVTGVLYASTHAAAHGGQLAFRDGIEHRPQAGVFVCFAGSAEHQVAPLRSAQPRLALAMTFYGAADAQPLAADHDIYVSAPR